MRFREILEAEFRFGPSDFEHIADDGVYVLAADDHSEPGEKISYAYYVLKRVDNSPRPFVKVKNLDARVAIGAGSRHSNAQKEFKQFMSTVNEQELKITSRMGNKIQAGDGVEIDLDKVDVDIDPVTKKPKIKPKGSTPGNVDPKDTIKPGQTVELS